MDLAHIRHPEILVLYKRSPLLSAKNVSTECRLTRGRFHRNHCRHYASLQKVAATLRGLGLGFHQHCRGRKIDYAAFNLVITVGGDGTFLEAARHMNDRQFIVGVNSDPEWSVGRFCSSTADGLKSLLIRILKGRTRVTRLYKLRVERRHPHLVIECLNDILVCHANPAAMSRYDLRIGRKFEEQRSSGIWFSTASGSTGAMLSAGGRAMPLQSRRLQYRPRELYRAPGIRYRLTGGLITPTTPVSVVSHISHGQVFVDGAHIRIAFEQGQEIRMSSSPHYVHLIHG